jgi:hypothetical protein
MTKQTKLPPNRQAWIDARKRLHLSHAQVQMARELGMDPEKLGGMANHKQGPWEVPLPQCIEELYLKRFKKARPDNVRSIEQIVADKKGTQTQPREPMRQQREAAHSEKDIQPSAGTELEEAAADDIPF